VHRLKTGQGQRVDTSLFEAGIVHSYWQSAICLATGESPGPMGSAHPLNAPYQAFRTTDGWITVGAANQANWLKILDVLEAPGIARDRRFADNAKRMENRLALAEALGKVFAGRTTADWVQRMESAGVPAGPVLSIGEMHADAQTLARDMIVEAPHSRLGGVKTLGTPVKFSATPAGVRRGAPVLGEHTREVLGAYGYADDEIDGLAKSGAVMVA